MRILMTTDTVGGVWTYAMELIAALETYCCDVTLATMGAPLRKCQRDEVRQLRNLDLRESTYRLEWMQDAWEDVDEAGEWLLELADEQDCELVHLNNYCHGNLPWQRPVLVVGHSCVWSWHHAVRGTAPGAEWATYFERVRSGLRAADHVIAPSNAMLAALDAHYGPLDSRGVIANARSATRFQPGRKAPMVLAAGRLWDEAKNVRLLGAVAPSIDWPVHLAGDVEHPEGGAIDLPGVRQYGQIPADELATLMSSAAIYALPAKYEPFGLSALEAALSGCALVLGDLPSLREIWGNSALFVHPNSADELTDTLNRLIRDMHLRSRYASRARERALELCPEACAASYYDVYQRLAHRAQWAATPLASLPASEPVGKEAVKCAS